MSNAKAVERLISEFIQIANPLALQLKNEKKKSRYALLKVYNIISFQFISNVFFVHLLSPSPTSPQIPIFNYQKIIIFFCFHVVRDYYYINLLTENRFLYSFFFSYVGFITIDLNMNVWKIKGSQRLWS
jgi:hypothetical protein